MPSEELHWFAYKVFFNKVFEIEDLMRRHALECYLPVQTVVTERNGIRRKEVKPVINSLIFMLGTQQQAQELQQELTGRVMLYTRTTPEGRRLPAPIPDHEMEIFRLVTSSGADGLEYLGDDPRRFSQGQRVRVTGGVFCGAEGHIHRIRGDRRLIVSIQGVCAVATSYIPQCFLEPI